ncbi:B12-binding domain-containing protein [Phycisphaerales bacterium AB-hyl4]|uniref:B12-binding domain-containing protein n=1 Tax=Natronomicrosphaera hydrolytica TaxID=3242702 RepID=A0ABV4U101_9BACT
MTVHLSPKSLAKAIGASESSLKRWIDAGRIDVARTPGGHRRIEQREALRFIRDEGMLVVDPAPLELGELAGIGGEGSAQSHHDEALCRAIVSGDAERVRSLALSMFVAGRRLASLCDGPFAAAMSEVGKLWQHDPDGIHQEHRATDACIQGLERLRSLIPPPPPNAPLAIGAAPGGDTYIIPSLMASMTLLDEQWQAINLGPNLPIASLERAIAKYRPDLVWLSVSYEKVMPELLNNLQPLAAKLTEQGGVLVVGGRAWRAPRSTMPDVHSANSMAELAAFAKGIRQARPPSPTSDG